MSPIDVTETGLMDRRRFLTTSLAAASFVIAVPALAGCGGSSGSSAKTIGVNLPFRGADVYVPLMAGAEAEAKARGYTVLKSTGSLKAQPQLAELNTWIGEQVNGLTIYPVDLNSLAPVVKHAHDQKIVVVAYAAPIPGADGATLFNEEQGSKLIGTAAGDWINKNLGGKANVALLTQNEQQTSKLRVQRAVDQMQSIAPGAKVVANAEAADPATALTATQSLLQAHPEINAMICINDQDLVGASKAVKQAGRKPGSVWMGGFDGSRQAMQLIVSGDVVGATAALPLKDVGRTTVSVPANIIANKGPKTVVNNYVLVDNNTPDLARRLIADFGT